MEDVEIIVEDSSEKVSVNSHYVNIPVGDNDIYERAKSMNEEDEDSSELKPNMVDSDKIDQLG